METVCPSAGKRRQHNLEVADTVRVVDLENGSESVVQGGSGCLADVEGEKRELFEQVGLQMKVNIREFPPRQMYSRPLP